jgi:putative transposase
MMAGMIPLILTGLLRMLRTRQSLVLENLALRHQLAVLQRTAPRPRFRISDRLLWVLLSHLWRGWAAAVSVVQPATVIRWQRSGFKLFWAPEEPPARTGPPGRRPGGPNAHPTDVPGQPPLGRAADSRGTPETGGRDLASDGIQVSCAPSEAAIADLEDLLDNHLGSLVAVDFFVVPTAMFKVLFVFVILAHGRRRVVHINVTDTPTAQWTAKQLVEAFPWDTAPRYLLRDRDGVYGVEFSSRVKGMGIGEVMTAPRWPWQNPYVERLIGTLRRECLETSWC